jgi:TolB-like protein/Tfp pilus assembly protein PilF
VTHSSAAIFTHFPPTFETLTRQRELKAKNAELPEQRRMEYRIGLNVGDVIVEGERLYGDGVNIAARLEGLAEPGGICISGTVYDQVENKLVLGYEYVGEQAVKNIAKPVRVYRVREPRAAVASESQLALALPDTPSIAVLPFTNMSGDPEQEYFSDGITEDLITDLAKLSNLFVIARNSTFVYKGKAAKVQDVSKELGVRYVLEGSVRKADTRVRITVQLIDATTGHHVWAERYDRELKDIFALQDEITRQIVGVLEVKLTGGEQERLGCGYTDNVEAYDSFLRGWEYYWRFTPEANTQARQMFERAVELDPKFALAYARLSATYWLEWVERWNPDPHTVERALALAQTAVALDAALPAAHIALGMAYQLQKQDAQAIAEKRKALVLAPNDATSYEELAEVLITAGQPEEAIKLSEKAMRLNPYYPPHYLSWLAVAYQLTGRYEEAIATHKRALSRNPAILADHVCLAAIYGELGRTEEAQAEAAEVLRLRPHFSAEAWTQALFYNDQAVTNRVLAALRKAGLQ